MAEHLDIAILLFDGITPLDAIGPFDEGNFDYAPPERIAMVRDTLARP